MCWRTLVSLLVLPLIVLAGGHHRLCDVLPGPDHLERREVMSAERASYTSGLELWGQLETIFLNKTSKSDIVTTSEILPSTNGQLLLVAPHITQSSDPFCPMIPNTRSTFNSLSTFLIRRLILTQLRFSIEEKIINV